MLNDFSWAQGWGSADDPRIITDVNGDGISDYIGFGFSATFIAYGGTFSSGGITGPGFASATAAVNDFGTSEGYTAGMQRGAAAAGVGAGDILYGQGFAGIYWYSAIGETGRVGPTCRWGRNPIRITASRSGSSIWRWRISGRTRAGR